MSAADPTGAVTVSLFGGLRVTAERAALDGSILGRRGQLVLARLALEAGVEVPREALADAVWGSLPAAAWRGSLRNTVSEIRRALARARLTGRISLDASGGGYVLGLPPGSTVDLVLVRAQTQLVEQLLQAGEYEPARELADPALQAVARPLLPGGMEEWVEGLRAAVGGLRVSLGLAAGEAALQLGEAKRAEGYARELIEAAPLREDVRRLLIRALRAAGRRAEALAAYDACRRLLAAELGALPAPATQALFLEILEEERAEQAHASAAPGPLPAAGPLLRLAQATPFVGRREILAWLIERSRLVGEAGTLVSAVSGEPGIGKTRLAAELAARGGREGIGTLYGRAEDRARLPYAALGAALELGLAGIERAMLELRLGSQLDALAALVPSLRSGEPAQPQRTPLPERLRAAIVAALGFLAGDRGVLLVLDDVQWATQAELEVVRGLLAEPEEVRAHVLLLHRDRARETRICGLDEDPRVAQRSLAPLTLEEIEELEAALPSAERARRAEQVWRASGGNALLAAELLAGGAEPGAAGGDRVGALLAERLARLPAGSESVLRLAAVAGLEFDPELVAAATSGPSPKASAQLDAARDAGLLVLGTEPGSRLAFRHALVRDALLERAAPAERARLHARLAAALEDDPGQRKGTAGDSARMASLADHLAAPGAPSDWRRAVRYALPVARQALAAGVYEDAAALAARTLAALERAGDPSPADRLDLEVLLGAAQRALGEPAAAETLRRAFAGAHAAQDAPRMADAALALCPPGAWSEAPYLDDRELERYELALAALGDGDPDRRARLLARLASALTWRRSGASGRAFAAKAERLARRTGEERTLAAVLATVRLSLAGSEQTDRQRALEEELSRLAERLDDPGLAASVTLWRFASSVAIGEGEALEPLLDRAAEQMHGLAVPNLRHTLAFRRASLALLRGRWGEAETLIDRAAELGRAHGVDPAVVEPIRLAQLMLLRGEQRRLGELRAAATPVFGAAGIVAWQATMAEIDAAAGHPEQVAERIDAVLDAFERDGPTVLCPGAAIVHKAELVVRLDDRERMRRVHRLILPLSGQGVHVAGFAGPVDYHLALLARALGEDAAAERHLAAAAGFCERLVAPRWLARCRQALASAA